MIAHLTVESRSDVVLRLMADFAHGLGCRTEDGDIAQGRFIRIDVPADTEDLFEILAHLALSTAKAGVYVDEPLCRVTFRHGDAPSAVNMAMRLMQFDVKAAPAQKI